LKEFHIWSHVDYIGDIDVAPSYLLDDTFILNDEDVHVVPIMPLILFISYVYVANSYLEHGGF